MHRLLDTVDFAAQIGERRRRASVMMERFYLAASGEIKENVKVPDASPDLTRRTPAPLSGEHSSWSI